MVWLAVISRHGKNFLGESIRNFFRVGLFYFLSLKISLQKFFNLRAKKLYFLKYKKTFFLENIRNFFRVGFFRKKYKQFFFLEKFEARAEKFHFLKHKKNIRKFYFLNIRKKIFFFFLENIRKFHFPRKYKKLFNLGSRKFHLQK